MPIFRRLPCWLACACLVFSSVAAMADGKAFTLPEKAKVEMADQRALISFDGKQETLVIDTQIKPVEATGASGGKQSYAWVVPLPAVPTKVEAGTVGMFDTLRELTRPELVNQTDALECGLWTLYLMLLVAGFIAWPKRMLVAVGLAVLALGYLFVGFMCVERWHGDGRALSHQLLMVGITTAFLIMTGVAIRWKRLPIIPGALIATTVVAAGVVLSVAVLGHPQDSDLYVGILLCGGLILLSAAAFLMRWGREAVLSVVILAPLVLVLGTARKRSMASAMGGGPVTLYQNETIGSYDTAVLASKDGAALTEWLDKNGYPLPADTAPMVAKLAKEGWCFAAMKLHESPSGLAHPHPMGFVFPTTQAIYPMRLTGVGQVAPLTVDLFVCGDQQAKVQGFHAGCAVGTTKEEWEDSAGRQWGFFPRAEPVPWLHPGLRRFAPEAKTLTWLRGVVPAKDMGHDIAIGWQPLTPHRDRFYSESVTGEFGAATGLSILGAVAIATAILARLKRKRAAWIVFAAGACAAAIAMPAVKAMMPKVEADRSEFGGMHAWRGGAEAIYMVIEYAPAGLTKAKEKLSAGVSTDAAWVRAEIAKTMDAQWKEYGWLDQDGPWRNSFHEGDSPNQFSVREEGGQAKVYFYNGVGQEFQIWPEPEKK